MNEPYALLSLIVLVVVLLVGFFRKVNMGLIAMGAALLLGLVADVESSRILAGFDASLFITMLGTSFLFCIAIDNGTLELFAKKLLALTGRRAWMVPILFGVFSFCLSAVGPGNVPTGALTGPLAIVLSLEMKLDPLFLSAASVTATNMGALSRVANCGVILQNLTDDTPYAGTYERGLFLSAALTYLIIFVLLYLLFRGHRAQPTQLVERLPPFTPRQRITLAACGLMVAAVFALGVNVGLVSILLGALLLILGISDERKVLQLIPWGSLILVTGVGLLMRLIILLGGIDLLSDTLLSIMTTGTTNFIMSFCGGLISLFASAMGVVYPALIPTLPGIVDAMGVSYGELITAIAITSLLATLSPVSSGGASTLARLDLFLQPDARTLNRIFLRMFAMAAAMMLGSALLSALGFYGLFQ